jgi:chloramphenicol-sensitive protein RarD
MLRGRFSPLSLAPSMNRGFLATLGAFVLWGLFPLYWHELRLIPSLEIMAHRVVWCAVFVATYLFIRRGRNWLPTALRQPRVPIMLAASSVLISINWLLYIWAVNNGHVVESSLGYFINPLVNVLLGVALLGERLRPMQWSAVALAGLGVAWLTWHAGAPPWIALTLAISFGTYGLIREVAHVESVPGLGVESAYLVLPALAYLAWIGSTGTAHFGAASLYLQTLLVIGGAVTALPLIWFAYGARLLPYSTVGILQYIAPMLQLLTGVLVFHEPFAASQAVGFCFIWAALGIYAADGLWRAHRMRAVQALV